MSESDHHRRLVKALGADIASDIGWKKQPIVYVDILDGLCVDLPPNIGSNRPDVFVRDISTGRAIIGEAKTPNDIDNQHSCAQFTSYFEYLRSQPEGELWIGVPWMSAGTAIRVSKLVRQQAQSENIPICVVAYMIGITPIRRFWRE